MKTPKFLLVLLLGIFVFQSCEKKTLTDTEDDIVKDEIPLYKFSKQINVVNKSGVNADITVYGDYKSVLEYQVELIPIFEKPELENLEINEISAEDDFNEKPPVHFDIANIKLPENAIGFKIVPVSTNKGWTTIFGYSYDCDAGFITKTNTSGKTKYKMGVLYTGSQWFYKTIASGTLKSENSAAQATPGNFYKMYIKYKNKSGSTCDAYFYSF